MTIEKTNSLLLAIRFIHFIIRRLGIILLTALCWITGIPFIIIENASSTVVVDAVLVGSILVPHGDFAYDPSFFDVGSKERHVANQIAMASRQAGRWLIDTAKPDIIFLSTPHGIKLDNNFGIYIAPRGIGQATIGDDLYNNNTHHVNATKKPYNVSLEIYMAPDVATDLLTTLASSSRNANVSGIYSYDDSKSIQLNWGEIIPLLLLPQRSLLQKNISTMIWSMPHRRYDHGPDMVPELLDIGKDIAKWATNRPERIAVIISGDLSHTHQSDGPYGFSNASSVYDKAIGKWVTDPYQNTKYLLQKATRLQPEAKSCGYTGYIMWHGFMQHCDMDNHNNDINDNELHHHHTTTSSTMYKSALLVDANVTYYGMMAAIFDPRNNIQDDNEGTASSISAYTS